MLLALTLAAVASPPVASPVSLEWQAPTPCPDAAAVTAMTHDLLRARRPDTTLALRARATVTRVAGDYSALLELRTDSTDVQRTLTAPDCQLLARGVALLVAVHLDAVAVSQAIGPALRPAEPAPPPPEPPPPLPVITPPAPPVLDDPDLPDLSPRPASAPVPEASFGGHLRLEGGLDAGHLPGLGGDIMLVGGVGAARWRVDLGVVGTPRRTKQLDAVIGRFDRVGGLARGCAIWRVPPRRDRFALLGCLGAEFGAIHATTDIRPHATWTPWAAALFGGAARVSVLGPLGLWLGAEAVIALVRPTTYTVATTTLYESPSRAGVRVNFGLDLQFGARRRRPPAAP